MTEDDADLLARFLAAVRKSRWSPEKIASSVGGTPSGPTIRRYLRGVLPTSRIDPATRRGMELFLTSHNRDGDQAELPYDLEREAAELAKAAAAEDPVLRILERESIAAVIRAQAVRESAWANRLAEQNTAARLATVKDVTGRAGVGEPIADAETDRAISRRQRRGRKRAAGE